MVFGNTFAYTDLRSLEDSATKNIFISFLKYMRNPTNLTRKDYNPSPLLPLSASSSFLLSILHCSSETSAPLRSAKGSVRIWSLEAVVQLLFAALAVKHNVIAVALPFGFGQGETRRPRSIACVPSVDGTQINGAKIAQLGLVDAVGAAAGQAVVFLGVACEAFLELVGTVFGSIWVVGVRRQAIFHAGGAVERAGGNNGGAEERDESDECGFVEEHCELFVFSSRGNRMVLGSKGMIR